MNRHIPALLLLCISGVANADVTNLIENGSFEATSQANGTWSIYASLPGWSSVTGEIEVRDNDVGTASDGVNFVELDANKNSDMWQSIQTGAGTVYTLSFDYSPRINQSAATNGISVSWNGNLLTDVTAAGGSANDWTTYSFQVTGTGNDKLAFWATGTSDSYGGNIDNVSLTISPVPEPESYAMLLAGLGVATVMVRRRRERDAA